MNNLLFRPIPGKGQNVSIGAASVQSTAFGSQTYAVQITATGNCHIEIGMSPTATATSLLVKATDIAMQLRVAPGEKIAVIQDGTATGTLNIAEMTN